METLEGKVGQIDLFIIFVTNMKKYEKDDQRTLNFYYI